MLYECIAIGQNKLCLTLNSHFCTVINKNENVVCVCFFVFNITNELNDCYEWFETKIFVFDTERTRFIEFNSIK